MPYYEGKDIKMFYEEIGVGEPVIFLHNSFSRGIIAFSAQMMDFQSGFRCIFPDLRGHGRTSAENLDWEMPQMAEDVVGLMDSLGIEKAHFIGFSLGGDVGFYCAVNYPERVRSLISIGVTADIPDLLLESAKNYEPDALIRNGEEAYIERLKANHREAHKGDWRHFIERILYNWRTYPVFTDEQLMCISCPCLLIAGEKDPLILEEALRRLKTCIKNIRIERVDGCGHGPHVIFEKPLEMNRLMLEFLKEQQA